MEMPIRWGDHPKSSTILLFVVISISGLATGAIATARGTDLLGLFVVLLGSIALLVASFRLAEARVRNLVLLAFLLRLGLAFIHAYIVPLPDSKADALTFERLGWEAAEAWLSGGGAPALSGAYLYSAWIGVLYFLFGRIPLLAQFTNVLLGTFTVYITWKLSFLITESRRAALIAAWITALFPTLNLYSAITMRESFIVFFTITSVYCFVLWLKCGRLGQMIGAGILLLAATALHDGMVCIGLVYALFFSFYHPKSKRWTAFSADSIFVITLIIAVTVALRGFLRDKLPDNILLIFSPDYLGQHTMVAAKDRAAYLPGLVPGSVADMLWQTPLRMLYFLYTPFPWMVSSPADVVGLIDALLYAFLSIYFMKGLASLRNRNRVLFWGITLILIVFLGTFAWGTSNYGTAIRHRQKIVWLLSITAAIGFTRSPWWRWLYPGKKVPSGWDSGGIVARTESKITTHYTTTHDGS